MTYICQTTAYYTDSRGNVTVYKAGDTVSAAKYNKLSPNAKAKFKPAGNVVSIAHLLDAFMVYHNSGDKLVGNYKQVWQKLQPVLDQLGYATDRWTHLRANHIALAGRDYQLATGCDFADLCPDLKAYASQWSN